MRFLRFNREELIDEFFFYRLNLIDERLKNYSEFLIDEEFFNLIEFLIDELFFNRVPTLINRNS